MSRKNYMRIIALIFALFATVWAFANLSSLRAVAEGILGVLLPIIVGGCIAFILNIPVRLIERLWISRFSSKHRRIRRAFSISVCLIFLFGALALLVGLIIPQVLKTADGILSDLPQYIDKLNGWYDSLSVFMQKLSVDLPEYHFNSETVMSMISGFMAENSQSIIGTSIGIVTTAFGVVIDGIFAVAVAVYILAQKERLGAGARRILYSIFSEKQTERILTLARLTEKTFSAFALGQLTEAVILGTLCFVGMLIFGIPYALLISLFVGVTALIPIFGGIIGAAVGAFLILFESPVKALIFIIFIITLQQLEGNIIYPRVVGSRVGLPGLWVLVAVSVGSEFGIGGMLIAVPVASLAYTVIGQITDARLKEKGLYDRFEKIETEDRRKSQTKETK